MKHTDTVVFQGRRFSRWVRFGLPAIVLLVLWLLYYKVPLLFSSFMVALGLFYILNPIVDYLETLSIRRSAGSAIVLIGIFVAFYYVFWLRIAAFSSDLKSKIDVDVFQENLIRTVERGIHWAEHKAPIIKRFIEPEPKQLPPVDSHAKSSRERKAREEITPGISSEEAAKSQELRNRIEELARKKIAALAPDFAFKLASLIPNLILIPYFTFFFLKDGRRFKKIMIQWIPNRYFEPALKFFYELDRRIQSYLQSMLLDCFLVGVLVGTGCAIVGTPYPMVFGVIAFVLNSIPLIGPLAYGAICLLITIGAGKPPEVILGFISVFLLSRLCDDLIFIPTIYGKSHQIHPVLVVTAVLVGETVAGVWGMFLAIPIVSTLFLGVQTIREISRGEEPPPLPSSAFAPFG